MLDFDGAKLAIAPFAEVGRSFGDAKAVGDGGGEEVVPGGVGFGEPASRSVHDEPLFRVRFVAPGVESGGGDGLVLARFGLRNGVGLRGDLRIDQERPESSTGCDDDGGGCGVGVQTSVPVAENVGGLVETLVAGQFGLAGVVDGVGETLGDDAIEVGVDVGLESEHIGWGEFVFGGDGFVGEDLPDTLIAVGGAPVESDGIGVVVGRDTVVGGGEDAVGRVDGLGEAVVGNGADPLLRSIESVGGNGADGVGSHDAAAEGDVADGVVADVALVVGIDEVLCGATEGGEGGDEAGAVGGGVDGEERRTDVGGIVDGPAEGERALFCGEDAGDDRSDDGAVLRSRDVEGYVFAAFDVDDLVIVKERAPGAVLRCVLGGRAGAADVLDVDVLDGGAEVGESPGDVCVMADDDEGDSGKRDAGDVEVARRSGGFEVCLVPDSGDAVSEVHVV
jgi:hypothetical protein